MFFLGRGDIFCLFRFWMLSLKVFSKHRTPHSHLFSKEIENKGRGSFLSILPERGGGLYPAVPIPAILLSYILVIITNNH